MTPLIPSGLKVNEMKFDTPVFDIGFTESFKEKRVVISSLLLKIRILQRTPNLYHYFYVVDCVTRVSYSQKKKGNVLGYKSYVLRTVVSVQRIK